MQRLSTHFLKPSWLTAQLPIHTPLPLPPIRTLQQRPQRTRPLPHPAPLLHPHGLALRPRKPHPHPSLSADPHQQRAPCCPLRLQKALIPVLVGHGLERAHQRRAVAPPGTRPDAVARRNHAHDPARARPCSVAREDVQEVGVVPEVAAVLERVVDGDGGGCTAAVAGGVEWEGRLDPWRREQRRRRGGGARERRGGGECLFLRRACQWVTARDSGRTHLGLEALDRGFEVVQEGVVGAQRGVDAGEKRRAWVHREAGSGVVGRRRGGNRREPGMRSPTTTDQSTTHFQNDSPDTEHTTTLLSIPTLPRNVR